MKYGDQIQEHETDLKKVGLQISVNDDENQKLQIDQKDLESYEEHFNA